MQNIFDKNLFRFKNKYMVFIIDNSINGKCCWNSFLQNINWIKLNYPLVDFLNEFGEITTFKCSFGKYQIKRHLWKKSSTDPFRPATL